jgi:hypothetical protein
MADRAGPEADQERRPDRARVLRRFQLIEEAVAMRKHRETTEEPGVRWLPMIFTAVRTF